MGHLDHVHSNVQPAADPAGNSTRFSSLRFLVITIGGIFMAEVIAMFLLLNFTTWPYWLQTLVDASIMLVLISPLMYYFALKPLLLQIEKRHLAEKSLRQAYDELERRVEDRTEQLRILNSDLEEEVKVRQRAEQAMQELNEELQIQAVELEAQASELKEQKERLVIANEHLLFSQERLNRAQEIAHLGSWELNLLNDQLSWSDEVYRIFGLEPQEFGATYEAFLEAVHPDDRGAVDEAYSGSIREGRDTYEIEHRIVRRQSGEVRVVHEKCEHFRDESGQIIRSVGMVHDITDRMQTEKRLAYLASFPERNPNPVIEVDFDGQVQYTNPAAMRILVDLLEQGLAHPWLAGLEGIVGAFRHGQTTPASRDVVVGSRVYQQSFYFLSEDCLIRIYGIDITERKQAEEALQKSEAMLRTVLNQMPSGVTVRDASTGELILSNTRSRVILGDLVKTTDQLSDYHGLHSDGSYYRNEEWPIFRSIATGETIDAEEIEVERNSGSHGTLSISSTPIHDSQGQIVSAVAVFHDITERKKAERELKQLNRTLQAHTASNKAMLRATSETELLDEVCKIVVEVCGHAMIWIGYAEDDQEKSVRPVANAGFEAGYLETLQITWTDTDRGRGPTGTAIRTGKPSSCRNMLTDPQFAPWREQALQRGYASSIVLPLIAEEKVFGAMTIYARQPDAFSPDEEKLLSDLASDLAHGIEMIRLREAHERITAALRESEERFRLALTHAPVTVAVQDRDLRYTWAYNQRTRQIDEIIGKTDLDLFPAEAEQLTSLKRRVIETGENASEQLWVSSNNQRLFLDLFIEPLKNENGEIEGVGLATVDLTAIKRAEEALRESEAKYRNLFENMTEEVHFWQLIYDETGHIKTWRLVDANSPSLKSWNRETVEEIRGHTTDEIFGPGATEHYMPIVQKIMTEGLPYSYEDYFAHLDKYFRFTSVPLKDHFITTGADITSLKKAEEVLRTARDQLELRVQERTEQLAAANQELLKEVSERERVEQQLRIQTAAMEAAANGMVITDPQGNIEWANPALTQITGYETHELIGQGMRVFQSGKHDADFYRQLWQTILAGNVWRGETTNRRKDGSLYVEEQTITPVRNGNTQISHFIAIKQDVTERNLMYAQLEASNRQLANLSMLEHQQRLLAEGLVESSVVLNMDLELDSVLDRIFEQTRRTIPYLIADIVLIKDAFAHVARQWGFEDHPEARTLLFEQGNLPVHRFPIWEAICHTRQARLIADTTLESGWDPYFGMTWIRSYLAAPLIYGDQVTGIMNLCSDQANAFSEIMANNLKAFAASAAVAIQNARLYEAEQKNRKVAEALSEASVALSETLDIQHVMETVLDYIQMVLPVDAAFLILSEGNEQYRIRGVRYGQDQSQVKNLLNVSVDLLNAPIVKPFFEKETSTLIRDSHQLDIWTPPTELANMRSWLGIPLVTAGKTMGMVVAANLQPDSFREDQVELAEAVVVQATVSLQNAWLFEQVRSGRQRLQLLSRHLVEIQENERKFIARELHDDTSQSLTSLKLGLRMIEQTAGGDPAIGEQVANLKILADEILESLHRLAMNLRPASLDHLGLVEALTSLVQSTGERSGIVARFKCLGADQRNRLTEDIESSIYRIVQESLTNIVRHAKATRADVILEWQDDQIMIIVEDDGIGIDLASARTAGHLGLVGMQERTEMLDGRLLIDSNPNTGTTLVVEIPYAH